MRQERFGPSPLKHGVVGQKRISIWTPHSVGAQHRPAGRQISRSWLTSQVHVTKLRMSLRSGASLCPRVDRVRATAAEADAAFIRRQGLAAFTPTVLQGIDNMDLAARLPKLTPGGQTPCSSMPVAARA